MHDPARQTTEPCLEAPGHNKRKDSKQAAGSSHTNMYDMPLGAQKRTTHDAFKRQSWPRGRMGHLARDKGC